jgi:HEAT repeat protein
MSVVLMCLMMVLPSTAPAVVPDEVDDAIASLEKAVKEKAKADIKHFVGLLSEKYASAKPEQQKEILRLDGVVMNSSDQELKDAALEAAAKTGDPKAAPMILKELDKKTTEDNAAYMMAVVKALGRVKDPKAGQDRLLKLTKHKSIDVVATAVEALGNYKDAPFETKKMIFDEILKLYGSYASAANDARNTTAKSKMARYGPAADETFKLLTNQSLKGYPDWSKWWNDTGKKATKW